MCLKNIDIKFVKEWSTDEIVKLYEAGGWWRENYDRSVIPMIIKGSYVFAVAADKKNKKAVAMGRVLSDGVSDAYIQDLVVLPEHRGIGVGRCLVKKLLDHCFSQGIRWVALIAEPKQSFFYEKLGFETMKGYVPMKYKKVDER